MAHAHPLPDGPSTPYTPPTQSLIQHSRSPFSSPLTLSTSLGLSKSGISERYTNPNQRRLQLRNAAFRGSVLPARRISPFTISPSHSTEVFIALGVDDENNDTTRKQISDSNRRRLSSPVGILQEITNSTRPRDNSIRSNITTIFHDSTAQSVTSSSIECDFESHHSSPHKEPRQKGGTRKLREVSGNAVISPQMASPLAKHTKGKRKAKPSRAPSLESDKYIDHLESELSALNSKVDALTSPTTTKAQSSKLRCLQKQVVSLRYELAEWERKFDERVDDEVFRRTKEEATLKARIRTLEGEIECRDMKINELEWLMEHETRKMKDTSSLEQTNRSLERRVDVLTELLALSPTRQNPTPSCSTPGLPDPSKRTPRPRSLMLPPRIPSPPGASRFSFGPTEAVSWTSRGVMSPSRITETPEMEKDSEQVAFEEQLTLQYESSGAAESSLDHTLSYQSAPSSSSRPTSMVSDQSSNGAPWGLPVMRDCGAKVFSRPRKMRRFPSGSCSLKPLVLPAASNMTPISAPASAIDWYPTPLQDTAMGSFGPTIAFPTAGEESPFPISPTPTPTKPSKGGQLDQVRFQPDEDFSEVPLLASESLLDGLIDLESPVESDLEPSTSNSVEIISFDPKRRSLQMELEQALEHPLDLSKSPDFTELDLSRDIRAAITSAQKARAEGMMEHDDRSQAAVDLPGLRYPSPPIPFTPKRPTTPTRPVASCSPFPRLHTPSRIRKVSERSAIVSATAIAVEATTSVKAVAKAATFKGAVANPTPAKLSPPSTDGIFARLTRLVTSVTSDPLDLARRILNGVLSKSSTHLGGLSWWLIGLIFRSRKRLLCWRADRLVDGESASTMLPGFDGSPSPPEASNARCSASWNRDALFGGTPSKTFRRSDCFRDEVSPLLGRLSSERSHSKRDCKRDSSRNDSNSTSGWKVYDSEDSAEVTPKTSLMFWGKLALALILTISMAVKHGPGAVLENISAPNDDSESSRIRSRKSSKQADSKPQATISNALHTERRRSHSSSSYINHKHLLERREAMDRESSPEHEYWGWEYAFTKNLTPADFQ